MGRWECRRSRSSALHCLLLTDNGSTPTTTSISDPSLTLTHDSLKIFTAFYVLTGIGILVELVREIGVGYVKEREDRNAARHGRHHKEEPPDQKM